MEQVEKLNFSGRTEKKLPKINEKVKDRIRFGIICILGSILWYMLFIFNSVIYLESDYYYMQGIGGVAMAKDCRKPYIPRNLSHDTEESNRYRWILIKTGLKAGDL